MATKTFKIGEYAVGGIIQVRTTTNSVNIDSLDWNTKEKFMGREFLMGGRNILNDMDVYLNEITSSYYADQVLNYIKENLNPKSL
jgi:hypothetical protein